jgi:hypothetical protein
VWTAIALSFVIVSPPVGPNSVPQDQMRMLERRGASMREFDL